MQDLTIIIQAISKEVIHPISREEEATKVVTLDTVEEEVAELTTIRIYHNQNYQSYKSKFSENLYLLGQIHSHSGYFATKSMVTNQEMLMLM